MRFTFESRVPGTSPEKRPLKEPIRESPVPCEDCDSELGREVVRFEKLLCSEPVDLARISREIRAHPEMEALAARLLVSLALCPGDSPLSVEEAALSLGTDRLRVLVYMWSLLRRNPPDASFWAKRLPCAKPLPATKEGDVPQMKEDSPESLYLLSFVRWLGLDVRAPATMPHRDPRLNQGLYGERVLGLAETLARDFLSLMPFLEPTPTPAQPKVATR